MKISKRVLLLVIFFVCAISNRSIAIIWEDLNIPVYKIELKETVDLLGLNEFKNSDKADSILVNGKLYTEYTNDDNLFFGLEIGPFVVQNERTGEKAIILVCDNSIKEKTKRGIFIGCYDYGDEESNLDGPKNDIKMIAETLNLDESYILCNPYESEIRKRVYDIACKSQPADELYFYFSGHGGYSFEEMSSFICLPHEDVLACEIRGMLDSVQGEKKIIIDSCHSGGFIGKGKGESVSDDDLIDKINKSIVNVFSTKSKYGNGLNEGTYKVITACRGFEFSNENYDWSYGKSLGVFTKHFCNSCGYLGEIYADLNQDGVVTTTEIKDSVDYYCQNMDYIYDQHVQVYPENESFLEFKDITYYDIPKDIIVEEKQSIVSREPIEFEISTDCDDFNSNELFIENMTPKLIGYDDESNKVVPLKSGLACIKIFDYKNYDLVKTVYIEVNIENLDGKRISDENKTWTIDFNKKIGKQNLGEFIEVLSSDGSQNEIELSSDGNSVYVKPRMKWEIDKQYVLIIKEGLMSDDGAELKSAVEFKFYCLN